MATAASDNPPQMSFRFGESFLEHYAGHIISDPGVALVELVANAYDAGATTAEIRWPSKVGDRFEICDNGVGMTATQLQDRWATLSYDRVKEQGANIEYPPDFPGPKLQRPAFGRNGQGRLGAFCFADRYRIETWRDGSFTSALVEIAHEVGYPFSYTILETGPRDGHGTFISTDVTKSPIPVSTVLETVGSKFAVVPWLTITINGQMISLTDLTGLATEDIDLPENGQHLVIHTLGAEKRDRTTFLRGITWWVNGRMVGEPSWAGLADEGAFLDGRTHLAGSCSFIIEADGLKNAVKPDWSGFYDTEVSVRTRERVHQYVLEALRKLDAGRRKQRKSSIVQQNRDALFALPRVRRSVIGAFIDTVMEQCPSLSERDLARVVQVFTNLEVSASGFDLLKRLAQCSPDDLATWERIMGDWSAAEAALVLDELGRRLQLLKELGALVGDRRTDELQEIHPLLVSGLWMFGPEFEAVEFLSNRALCTVVAKLLQASVKSDDIRRPDIVALSDRSLSIHSCDEFDEQAEATGLAKVLIVELKRGGSTIGEDDVFQAQKYATHLRRENAVQQTTQIAVYVLGARVDPFVRELKTDADGTIIKPLSYDIVIRRAQARTFHLEQRLRQLASSFVDDPEIEEVLAGAPLSLVPSE